MLWDFQQPYLIVLVITLLIAVTAAAVAWRQRGTPGVTPFVCLMLAVAWWVGMRTLEGAATTYSAKLAFGKLAYFGIASVPVFWLMFAFSYCGFNRFLTRRNILLLWIVPVITIILALTNDLHGWLWSRVVQFPDANGELVYNPGWWWYVTIVYNYSLILMGAAIFLRQAIMLRNEFRRQAVALLIAVAIPLAANILHFLRIDPIPGLAIDLTPFAFSISGIVIVWGLYQFHLFDLAPVARDLLVESMSDGSIVLDEHDRIVDLNPAAQQMLGLPAAVTGQLAEKVFAPWPELLQRYSHVTEVQDEINLEVAGAGMQCLELHISPLNNRRGKLVGRLITLHNISLRKQTEAQLRQLSGAVEQSSASIMITDTGGRIVYVNPSFTHLTEYSFEEVLGRNPNILKSGATPAEEYARLWQTIQTGGVWRGELLNKKKSGELYWESAVISPIADATGVITNYVAVKEDITGRKQTELELQQSRARLKAIFDNAAVGIALLDRDGRYIQFNERWAEMLWYPPEQLYQLRDADITHRDDWPQTQTRQQALMNGEIDYYELEKRFVRRDGSIFWGLLSMTPIRNAQGHFQAGLGVVADITERKHVEEIEHQRLVESEALRATMTEMLGELELTKLLHALMERVVSLLQADQGELALYDQQAGWLATMISYNQGRDFIGRHQALGEGPMGHVALTRQPLIIEDDALWEGHQLRAENPERATTLLVAPLVSGPLLLGVLAVGADNHRRKFGTQDVRLLETFAQQTVIAIRNARLFEEVQQRARRLELINNLSMNIINVSADLRELLQASVDGLTQVLGADQVGLALFDGPQRRLVVQADHPAPGNQSAVGTQLPVEGNLSLQRVLESHQPVMVLDAQHDPLLSSAQDVMIRQRIESLLIVPLMVSDEVIGTIGFDALGAPRRFTEEEIGLAQTVANLVAVRIEQARLFEAERAARQQAQRHAADMRAVYAVTRATSRSLAVEDVLSQALSSAIISLKAEAGAIALLESAEVSAPLRLVAERNLSSNVLDWLRTRWLGNILRSQVFLQSAVTVITGNDEETSLVLREMAEEMNALGWGQCLAIPLLHREQSLGVICLFAHQAETKVLHDMVLLSSIGHQVATAVTNAQLFQSTMSERGRFKALIEASRDGAILTSNEGRVLVVNARALHMLHLTGQPEEWMGAPFVNLIAALRRRAPSAALATIAEVRRLQSQTEAAEGEFEVSPRTIGWQSLPVQLGTKPLGRLFVLRDLTEDRAIERMREDMTRTMVHDLRNPLSSIAAALDMVLDGTAGPLPDEQHQILSIAQYSAERMMQLVSAILDVSRLESGHMPIHPRAFSLTDLVESVLMTQRALAEEKHIRLESTVASILSPVWADFGLIQRVLQNLIGNAVKFTPPDGLVRVEAKLEAEADPQVLWISVSDTGSGIPLDIQNRLFQKFVTGPQQEHGSGLGLAFCKLAIEAHRQHIWVDSVPGHGATVTFSLAVADEDMLEN